jgi:hypothetical protein
MESKFDIEEEEIMKEIILDEKDLVRKILQNGLPDIQISGTGIVKDQFGNIKL